MSIDPNDPPPLPVEVTSRRVKRADQTYTHVVTKRDAARLLGVPEPIILKHIAAGELEVCRDPTTNEHLVLTDSLWLLIPEEQRRG